MAISANIFSRCVPALGTDIARCGTVTQCDVIVPESDEVDSIFQDEQGNFRWNDALFIADLEVKACQAITNGLYDFLMANKVDMSSKLQVANLGSGLYEIRPFIEALQKSIINNEYWTVSGGTDPGGNNDWQVDVASQSSIPVDVRWFAVGDRVFIDGQALDGTATHTAWEVTARSVVGNTVRLSLVSQNANSSLDAAQLENPVTGVLVRGIPNVNDYEEFCAQIPGLNTNKLVPFWLETTRFSMCVDELYMKYHEMLRANNPQYKMFGDIEAVLLNKQIGQDFQRRWVNAFWFNKPLANQSLSTYRSLEQITTPTTANLNLTDEGRCVGRRANAVGILEQLAECGRLFDLQGQVLNLQELFDELYNIMRIREANGHPNPYSIDLVTDSFYATQIEKALINYYNAFTGGNLRYNIDVNGSETKQGKFGFQYKSFKLRWPPVTLNLVWHRYFDDRLAAAVAAGQEATGRQVWILDWAGIRPGMVGTNRKVLTSGDVQDLAKVDQTYMCVMEVNKRTQNLTSFTWTAVLDCPQSNLVLTNIAETVPEHAGTSGTEGDFYGEYTTAA